MNFEDVKNYNWENLKRIDLGISYKDIFIEIYLTSIFLRNLLLNFESIYSQLLPADQNRLSAIWNKLLTALVEASSFSYSGTETLAQGTERAKGLLERFRVLHRSILPEISELQAYLKNEQKTEITNSFSNFRNELDNFKKNLDNTINIKINEFDRQIKKQESDIGNYLIENKNKIENQINELVRSTNEFKNQITGLFTEHNKTFRKALEDLDNRLQIVDTTLNKAEETKTNVEKLNESVQNFSLSKVVSGYGEIFDTQALLNWKFSKRFLIAFVVGIFGSILLVYVWFTDLLKELNSPDLVRNIEYYGLALIIRITVIFFIIWLIKELLKNYNSNLHQYHLNAHRSNSLKSFEIIVKNNILPANRDEVVKQVAQAIFSHQEDGLLPHDKKEINLSEVANLLSVIKK